MKYYLLSYDYENDDDYIIVTANEVAEKYNYDMFKGEHLESWDNDIKFYYTKDDGNMLTDYLATDNRWLVVSQKFRNVIDKIECNSIQYLDIKIINKQTNDTNDTYKVANVINVLEALDLENSKYDIFELGDEKIISVEKYALKKERIQNHHIFKLKGDTIPVFVSERVKDIIVSNNLLGFAFLEVKVV
ncbi:hypothetical protein BD780_000955 [Clostridium tetanomorphum]|uniref:Maleate cis-trans isomerase n=2 Tax=Clostridium tetanomorphum TaxID=1553 RepID=A0A923E4I9_CLOTT|nr:DUF1629 domain-containing protein [Clostridium tetanomorphum]KAJ49094.1 hypothetical protein CTM_24945 [Clostridium tetanomorphum DSM 665]KAJ49695.1 hypothetical protein CTM_21783 [Clostridium tetanomorphum DSM 665]MBC2396285.1 maleate cis-trans isomerase [Clostridium tetanomorphum]MBP1864283.1 hypothetical protein [Clostridium tetanomorphum]NRS83730.1 hypothetical protein [Clostridium tetanomorphum]